MKFFKGDDLFFRKDEEGRDLFYPWGCPGEAFHINADKKRDIRFFFGLFEIGIMSAITMGIFFFAKQILSISLFYYWAVISTLFSIVYIAYMAFLKKTLSPFLLPKISRPRKFYSMPWIVSFLQLMAIWVSVQYSSSYSIVVIIFWIFCSASFACSALFAFFLQKTRGYILFR